MNTPALPNQSGAHADSHDRQLVVQRLVRLLTLVERTFVGDKAISAWDKNERAMRKKYGVLAWGTYVPMPAGEHHWTMTVERTLN